MTDRQQFLHAYYDFIYHLIDREVPMTNTNGNISVHILKALAACGYGTEGITGLIDSGEVEPGEMLGVFQFIKRHGEFCPEPCTQCLTDIYTEVWIGGFERMIHSHARRN
jgi:hypothetical protein